MKPSRRHADRPLFDQAETTTTTHQTAAGETLTVTQSPLFDYFGAPVDTDQK